MSKILKATMALLVFSNVALAAPSGMLPESGPKLTQSEVSQIVKKFLGQIGQPATQIASIRSTSPANLPSIGTAIVPRSLSANAVLAPIRWQITIPDPVHPKYIEVSDATGQVLHYIRDDNSNNHQPLGTPIPKAQAIAQASAALINAGAMKTNELAFNECFLSQSSSDSEQWFVSWVRMFHAIPYREQGANVSVDSQTGEVAGFSVNFRTPPPASAVFNISRDQAKAIATQAFANAGLQFDEPPVVKAEVVQPNGFWKPGGTESDRQPDARVAWTCHFKNGRQSYEAWIDAETGDLIGGQYAGSRGMGKSTLRRTAPKNR